MGQTKENDMRGTNARKKIAGSLSPHRFYLIANQALREWSETTKRDLASGKLSRATVALRYAPDRPVTAVATYSELLDSLDETLDLLGTTVLVTAVVNLESYLEEVFYEFFRACPTALTHKENANEDQIDNQARNAAVKIAGKPFERVLGALRHYMGIDFSVAPEGVDTEAVLEIIATRNILMHNSGIVDGRYLARVPSPTFEPGQKRPITPRYIGDSLGALDNFRVYVDNLTGEKIYKLTGKDVPEYPEYGYGKRPKRGAPTKLVKCWCIHPEEQVGIPNRSMSWSSRSALLGGLILSFCVFEEQEFHRAERDKVGIFLPPKATPAQELSKEAKDWLESEGITIAPGDIVVNILQKLRERAGLPSEFMDDEPDF